MPVIFTDTAGLRADATDAVEQEGIRRTRGHISGADIVIWVWSADVKGSDAYEISVQPDLVIRNKCDLAGPRLTRNDHRSDIRLSTVTRDGLSNLLNCMKDLIKIRYGHVESPLFASARQKLVAERSIRHLNDALVVVPELPELKAENIRRASEEIGRLTGRMDVEEWLGAIFSRFCIGK